MQWDVDLFRRINDAASTDTVVGFLLTGLSEWGDYLFGFSLLVFFIMGRRKMAVYGLLATGVAVMASRAISLFHYVDRPFIDQKVNQLLYHIESNSFPSDHAAAAFAIAILLLRFSKPIGSLYILLAVLLGYSRVWVGVHYPLDILVGSAIGILAGYSTFYALDKFQAFEWATSWLTRIKPVDQKKPLDM